MSTTIDLGLTYEAVDCPTCGLVYMLPETFVNRRRKDGQTFFCPSPAVAAHRLSFGETEADRLTAQLERTKRQLESAQARLTHERDQAAATERALRAQRGANTKLRKRISNGVCPCCNRTFADLARHIAGQHPDFVETQT
jgi:hypothetical protein